MKTNKVEAWLARGYSLRVDKLSDEDGGGYLACVPQFGSEGLSGTGETETEAVESLLAVLRVWFGRLAERGEEPAPPWPGDTLPESYPSGKLNLRLPRELHHELAQAAERNGISLNQYLVSLLAERHGAQEAIRQLAESLKVPSGDGAGRDGAFTTGVPFTFDLGRKVRAHQQAGGSSLRKAG